MKIANLMLAAVCLAASGCSARNSAVSNSPSPQPATARTTSANANVVNAATANATPANAQPAQKASGPDAVVKELYKEHDANKSPFFQTKDRAAVDKYFTKKLADLIWQDAVSSKGEVGALEADPLYDAQDTKITDLKIQADQVDGDQALVLVTFKNFGKAKSLIYNVERENGAWKISNITGDNYNLLDTLQAAAKG